MVQSSTSKQYSGDSYFREQDFIQTNLHSTLPRILMPVLCYPSQPGVYSGLPQASLTMRCLLSWWGEFRGAPGNPHWGILTATLSCTSGLAVHRWHPVVVGRRGMLSSSGCLYVRALGRAPTAWSSCVWEASKVWVSALSLYTRWWPDRWPDSFCYRHCHLRVGLFAYCQPVILWLGL
jgi:hypothetical protein